MASRYETAEHEAGHAVMRWLWGLPLTTLELFEDGAGLFAGSASPSMPSRNSSSPYRALPWSVDMGSAARATTSPPAEMTPGCVAPRSRLPIAAIALAPLGLRLRLAAAIGGE